jgi:hypothetical protein
VRKLAILSLMIIGALVAGAQSQEKMARRKLPGGEKPECAQGSICFSGEVSAGEEFRKPLNDDLEFVLRPVGVDLKQGWQIEVVSRKPEGEGPPPGHCSDALAMVVNGPYRQHNQLLIDMSFLWVDGGGGGRKLATGVPIRHELCRLPRRVGAPPDRVGRQ